MFRIQKPHAKRGSLQVLDHRLDALRISGLSVGRGSAPRVRTGGVQRDNRQGFSGCTPPGIECLRLEHRLSRLPCRKQYGLGQVERVVLRLTGDAREQMGSCGLLSTETMPLTAEEPDHPKTGLRAESLHRDLCGLRHRHHVRAEVADLSARCDHEVAVGKCMVEACVTGCTAEHFESLACPRNCIGVNFPVRVSGRSATQALKPHHCKGTCCGTDIARVTRRVEQEDCARGQIPVERLMEVGLGQGKAGAGGGRGAATQVDALLSRTRSSTDPVMHPMLNIAIRAARAAGRIINRASVDIESIRVTRKQVNDFVTEVDRASEQVVVETLLESFPAHSILAEESGFIAGPKCRAGRASDPGVDPSSAWLREMEHLWIIDPIDGTTNFIHGIPQFAVSIGLLERGVLTQAVVYNPAIDEMFTASRGAGAFLNNRRMRVTRRVGVRESVIGTGFPSRSMDQLDEFIGYFRRLTLEGAGFRRPGAAALDLAYVAAGRFDAFFEIGLSPWDVAGGALLVTEAGGLVGDFQGESEHLFGGRVLAANPVLFAAMVQRLKPG